MNERRTLRDLRPGEHAEVDRHEATGSMRRRLLDIGLVENCPVECVGTAPGGDPAAYLIRGAVIALRSEDSESIFIRQ